jgi:hypothetical protein
MRQPGANFDEFLDFLGLLSFMGLVVALAWVCL